MLMNNEAFTWLQPGAWRKPCIVHVTMVANGRRPLFGSLAFNGKEAVVEKTPLGWVLVGEERRMLELCPEIRILADKVMPDHHHMVLQVQRSMSRSIREVLRGYMQGCKAEARGLGFKENLYEGPPFYRVLTHKGQLHAMIEYVKANAERAWQRRLNPDLFRMHRQTAVWGLPFTSMGNHFLLEWPDRQLVEVSRSSTEERFYKPGGVYFDACSKGKLLLLEPEEQAFVHPDVRRAAEETLRRKAEAKHLDYAGLPVESRRYRFMALNEMGRMMVDAGREGRG
ncbi:MAG: hypothetical protein IJ537_10815 [Bacteroidaceae bacterium]|nr:hypothetical protein [Bacteroidaceae bacterium]